MLTTPTFDGKHGETSQMTFREIANVQAFDVLSSENGNAYIWEISNITQWKSAEMDVSDRVHELAKFDEIIFEFKMYDTGKPSTADNLASLLAKIILALPAKFSYKKVSITDLSLLDAHFEWEMFLFYT